MNHQELRSIFLLIIEITFKTKQNLDGQVRVQS